MQRWDMIGLIGVGACILTAAVGCASTPPSQELIRARTAYNEARTGPAGVLEQDRLLAAKQALDRAESEHRREPGSSRERHLAYIATRSAEMADVYGEIAVNERDKKLADQDFSRTQDFLRARAEMESHNAAQALGNTSAALERERQCRIKMEAALRTALENLKSMAQVKDEERGLVVTLNGSVLFETAKSDLLPAAKDRLMAVALAISDLQPGQTITIEGHTDSVGSDAYNEKLSRDRAESVRTFLVSQGVPAEKVSAIGFGESRPITPNLTPEGRANNRRVEIVISRSSNSGWKPEPAGPTSSR
jgi:outer membrane protein OmpA-like peptidoglycan-associated protein